MTLETTLTSLGSDKHEDQKIEGRRQTVATSIWQRGLAWSVHGFTASGLIIAFVSVVAISEKDFRIALLCSVAALVVDAVDGSLARLAKAREVLPQFDGKMLDWVSDFVNFSFLPAYLFYNAELVPTPINWVCVTAMLLSSAYHFGNKQAVTAEGHFRGFPAFWNIVVFYLVLIPFPVFAHIGVVTAFFVLHFVPVHFVYPTRMKSPTGLVWMVGTSAIISGAFAAHQYGNDAQNPLFWQISLGSSLVLLIIGCYLTVATRLKQHTSR